MQVPSTGIIRPKNSVPIFDERKGSFPCCRVKKDVNESQGPHMGPKLQHRFFQQQRLNTGNKGGLGTGAKDMSIRFLRRQRIQSRISCNRRCLQINPSHSR